MKKTLAILVPAILMLRCFRCASAEAKTYKRAVSL